MDENEIETLKAEIAAKDAIIQEMKTAADAQHAEAEKLGQLAEEAATAGKVVAEENETLKARIAELEANAKTAEQIAAEKYGAALPAGGAPAGQIDIDALRAQYESVKQNPVARVKFIRELPDAQFNALFKA